MSEVQVHRFYRHYKGGLYYVLAIAADANVGPDHNQLVIYIGSDGRIWHRPLKEFIEPVKMPDRYANFGGPEDQLIASGGFHPRFCLER